MSYQPGANLYSIAFGNRPESVEVPHYDERAPFLTDVSFPIGKIWIWRNNGAYILVSQSSIGGVLVSNWQPITSVSGAISADSVTATNGDITADNGNLALSSAGNKIEIATGTNASVGVSSALVAGTITVNTSAVTANSLIFLTAKTPGGTQGELSVGTITPGTSFVINSSSNTDTSTVQWWIVN